MSVQFLQFYLSKLRRCHDKFMQLRRVSFHSFLSSSNTVVNVKSTGNNSQTVTSFFKLKEKDKEKVERERMRQEDVFNYLKRNCVFNND